MTGQLRLCGVAAASVLGLCTLAQGGQLAIDNPGFELDVLADGAHIWAVTGWTVTGSAGTFNPTADQFLLEAPEGSNTAFSNGGILSQQLVDVLVAHTAYSLSVEIGNRLDTDFPGYVVQLFAGDSLLAEDVSMFPAEGTFETSVVEFTALADDPRLGLPLQIRLQSLDGVQVNFDNVRLEANPIPGPAVLAMLALAGAVGRRRRR